MDELNRYGMIRTHSTRPTYPAGSHAWAKQLARDMTRVIGGRADYKCVPVAAGGQELATYAPYYNCNTEPVPDVDMANSDEQRDWYEYRHGRWR